MSVLRDVTINDLDKMLEWRNLPEVSQYMYTDHVITADEHEAWFSRMMVSDTCKYWIIVSGGEDVGVANIVQIDRQNSRCLWAFYLVGNRKSSGIAALAEYDVLQFVFNNLGLHKLCCEVLDTNEIVADLHKSFGFVEEGRLREHICKGGAYHGVIELGILRHEWETLAPGFETRLARIRERNSRVNAASDK